MQEAVKGLLSMGIANLTPAKADALPGKYIGACLVSIGVL